MKVNRLSRLALFALIFAGESFAQPASNVTLDARFAGEEVPANRTVELQLVATWETDSGEVRLLPLAEPEFSNLTVVASSTSNRVAAQAGARVSTRTITWELRGETLGMAYADGLILKYRDAEGDLHTLTAPRLSVKITDRVRDPLANASMPLAVAALFVFGGIAAFVFHRNRKHKARVASAAEADDVSPEAAALAALQREVDLKSTDPAAELAKVDRLLRTYLHDALDIGAEFGTTAELAEALQGKNLPMGQLQQLTGILQECDMVKFSGAAADGGKLVSVAAEAEAWLRGREK